MGGVEITEVPFFYKKLESIKMEKRIQLRSRGKRKPHPREQKLTKFHVTCRVSRFRIYNLFVIHTNWVGWEGEVGEVLRYQLNVREKEEKNLPQVLCM